MLKTRKRWISLLLTVAMIVAFGAPFAGVASAAGTSYSAATAVQFDPSSGGNALAAAQLLVTIDPYTNGPGVDNASVALFEVVDSGGSRMDISKINGVTITTSSQDITAAGSVNSAVYAQYVSDSSNKTVRLTAWAPTNMIKSQFTLSAVVDASDAASGDVKASFSQTHGNFSPGTQLVAIAGSGSISAAVQTAPTFGDDGGKVSIRIQENTPGGLDTSTTAVKLKLSSGFEWTNVSINPIDTCVAAAFGTPDVSSDDGRTLKISYDPAKNTLKSSSSEIVFDINAKIDVYDETIAKTGDVTASLGGDSTWSPSGDITVGTYGDYAVKPVFVESKDIIPGLVNQDIGKFELDEALPGTLTPGRTITLTLPDNVKWSDELPKFDAGDSSNYGSFAIKSANGSGTFAIEGSDRRVIKATIDVASSGNDTPKLVFNKGTITANAGFTGDIALTIGGSAQLSGTIKVAAAVAPVSVKAASKPDIAIGQAAQATGDITIAESAAETFLSKDDTAEGNEAYVVLKLPTGVTFASEPTFTVSSGDLQLGSVTLDTDNNWVKARVKSTSSTASTITVSGIKVTVDRTVPVGDIDLKVGGNALVENDGGSEVLGLDGEGDYKGDKDATNAWFDSFNGDSWVASVPVANVSTPADTSKGGTSVFKIGESSYTLNGTAVTMDAAPYIKDGRTYMPVRFAANALGVADANIIWDQTSQKATVIKGDRVVQFTVGSTTLTVNGAAVTMDAAPEIVSGRVMVPIRFLGQALSANFAWDATAQTVTVTF